MDVAIQSQLFRKIIIFWRKQNKDELYFSFGGRNGKIKTRMEFNIPWIRNRRRGY